MRLSLSVFSLLFFAAACSNSNDPYRVVGELASDRIELVAESSEPIIEIVVAEGTEVVTGDVLLRQDPTRAAARLAETEGALRQAEARLAELVRGPRAERIDVARANLEGAEQDLVFLKAEYERIRMLEAKELASEGALDRTKAAYESGTALVLRRRAELAENLAGTTVEELLQAEAGVEQALARRDAAALDLARHEIRAPTDGIADSRLFEIGERPNPGQPVMVMLGGQQVFARVYVPEHIRVNVLPGTGAEIFVDGREEPLAGRVRWVASEAAFTPYAALTERDRGRLTYLAKIDIVDDIERLPDGVPLEARLLVQGSQ